MRQTRLESLRQRANRVGATGNYFDAVNDILNWPTLKEQILDDLEQAVQAHETRKEKKAK